MIDKLIKELLKISILISLFWLIKSVFAIPYNITINVNKYVTTNVTLISVYISNATLTNNPVDVTFAVQDELSFMFRNKSYVYYEEFGNVTLPWNHTFYVTLPEYSDYRVIVCLYDGVNKECANVSFTYTRPIKESDIIAFYTKPDKPYHEVEDQVWIYANYTAPPHPIKIRVYMNDTLLEEITSDTIKEAQLSYSGWVGPVYLEDTPIIFTFELRDLLFNKSVSRTYIFVNRPPSVNLSVEDYVTTSIVSINITVDDPDSENVTLFVDVYDPDNNIIYSNVFEVCPPENKTINITLEEFGRYFVIVKVKDEVNSVKVNKSFIYTRPISVEDVLDFYTIPYTAKTGETEKVYAFIRVRVLPHPINLTLSVNDNVVYYKYFNIDDYETLKAFYNGTFYKVVSLGVIDEIPATITLKLKDLIFNKEVVAIYNYTPVFYEGTLFSVYVNNTEGVANLIYYYNYLYRDVDYYIFHSNESNVSYTIVYSCEIDTKTPADYLLYINDDIVGSCFNRRLLVNETVIQKVSEDGKYYTCITRTVRVHRLVRVPVTDYNKTKALLYIDNEPIFNRTYTFCASPVPKVSLKVWRDPTNKRVYVKVSVIGGYGPGILRIRVWNKDYTRLLYDNEFPFENAYFNRTIDIGAPSGSSFNVDLDIEYREELDPNHYGGGPGYTYGWLVSVEPLGRGETPPMHPQQTRDTIFYVMVIGGSIIASALLFHLLRSGKE